MNHPELANQPPRQSSGGALKWILLGCGGLMLLMVAFFAVSGWAVYRSFNTDPAKVDTAAHDILTFEKPAGLKGVGSMSMMGFKMATYGPEDVKKDGAMFLMVATFPSGKANQQQYQQQIEVNMKQQGHSAEGAERLPNETFKVRGNDVTAQVSAMKDQNSGTRTLHYTMVLEGDQKKLVMIAIGGNEKTADHAWVQKFLDTVK